MIAPPPFFSIIIPVFNTAPYLRECLDSVLTQTFGDWEALCVDDGSTDGSGAILDEYAVKDPRFRVFHQSNAGVSAARNKALDNARGEWLCFLDADDKVECYWLHDIAEGTRRHPEVDWIRTSYRDWFEGLEPEPWPEGNVHKYEECVYDNIVPIVWRMLSYSGMMVLNVFRRESARDIRFPVGLRHSEDMCFALDYMMHDSSSHRLLTIRNDDYRYRMRHSSVNHTMRVGDVTHSLGIVMGRWKSICGKWGAFSPAIDRHVYRCLQNGNNMTSIEADSLRRFLWRASKCGFFWPFHFSNRSKCVRWFLFMVSGNPRILTEKAGRRWFVRKKAEGVHP